VAEELDFEDPDSWLRHPDPWQIPRPGIEFAVPLQGSFELRGSTIHIIPNRPSTLIGVAHDRPVVGYGGQCVNTLRLWAATAPKTFDFAEFSHGDFVGAVIGNVAAESLTRVLYPDDSTEAGGGPGVSRRFPSRETAGQEPVRRLAGADHRRDRGSRHHVRLAGEAHSRVTTRSGTMRTIRKPARRWI